ncbi:MAG TPA: OmpA family protein [Candidatus Hypogeohydataceae bacterium YC38]|nr:flagellar motor protein MotB [Candidatus Brocadiales bacterium]
MYIKRCYIFKLGAILTFAGLLFGGCGGQQKILEEQVSRQNETIQDLQRQNAELQARLAEKDNKAAEEYKNLDKYKQMLEGQLKDTGATVKSRGTQLVISLPSSKLFDAGQYTLKPQAKEPLSKIAKALTANFPTAVIRVEGHTDNQPLKKLKDKFKSNWELSSARAASVLHYFVEECRMDPKRVYLAGLGEHHPVDNNATKQGRQKNRRVEIVVLTRESI